MRLIGRLMLGILLLLAIVAGGGFAYLSTVDFNDYRELIAREAKRATGRELVIRGDIEADLISLTPTVIVGDVSFANAPWGTRREMARFRRLEVQIDLLPLLAGRIGIDRLVLVEPEIFLETDGKGRGNWLFEKTSPAPDSADTPADSAGPLPVLKSIRIENARLTFRDGQSGQETAVTLGRVTLRADGADGPIDLRGSGTVNGKAVTVSGEIGPFASLLAGDAYAVALDLRIGGSDLGGKITLSLGATPPRVSGTLSANLLDLDDLIGAAGAVSGAAPKPEQEAASEPAKSAGGKATAASPLPADTPPPADTSLPLEVLKAVDADLRIASSRLIAAGVELVDVEAHLRLAGGRLEVSSLSAGIAGGTVKGGIVLDGRRAEARVNADLRFRRLDAGPLSRQILGREIVAAPLNVDLRVTSAGRTLRGLIAGLDGRATAVAGQGRFSDAAFDLLSADLLTAITPWAPNRTLGLTCAVADFVIAKGVARRRVLLVDTTRAAIVGRKGGVVDLNKQRVDLLLDHYTKGISLASVVAVPIRVRGPFSDIDAFPDAEETLKGVALAPITLAGKAAGGVLGALGAVVGSVGSVIGLGGGKAEQRGAVDSACPQALAAVEAGRPWPSEPEARPAKADAEPESAEASTIEEGGQEEGSGVGEALIKAGEGVGEALRDIGKSIGNIFK